MNLKKTVLIPLVFGLFGLAFVESWLALVEAAKLASIPYPEPWPFMIDGFILASALLVVEARKEGHTKFAWWPRLGLIGATILSTTIQALYAPQEDWVWALHAWSPLAVLASFECLVWLFFSDVDETKVRRRKPAPVKDPGPARFRAWISSGVPELVPPVSQLGTGTGTGTSHEMSQSGTGAVPGMSQSGTVPVPGLSQSGTGTGTGTSQEMSQSGTGTGTVPVPGVSQSQSQNGTSKSQNGSFTAAQKRKITKWVLEERRSGRWIANELGLSESDRTRKLGPLLKEIQTVSQEKEKEMAT